MGFLEEACTLWGIDVRKEVVSALGKAVKEDNLSQIMDLLEGALQNESERRHSLLDKWKFDSLIVPQKISASYDSYTLDKDKCVRSSLMVSLGEVVKFAGEKDLPKIFKLMQEAVKGEFRTNESSRALEEIVKFSGSWKLTETLDLLEKAMGNECKEMRSFIASVIGKLAHFAKKEDFPRILNLLQKALWDEKSCVRCSAISALERAAPFAEKEALYHILDLLQDILEDENYHVKKAADSTLSRVMKIGGEKIVVSILDWQKEQFENGASDMDSYAVFCFKKVAEFAEEAHLLQILDLLEKALENEGLKPGGIDLLSHIAKELTKRTGRFHEKNLTDPFLDDVSGISNFIPCFEEKAGRLSEKEIAQYLWLNPSALVSEGTIQKVNEVAVYLKEHGFELMGVKADGNCFCNAFLKSYETLSKKIPVLDIQENKVSYLRDMIASQYGATPKGCTGVGINRIQEIKKNGEWLTAFDEGDLLAEALLIPIRIVTINQDQDGCGIIDMLTFPEKDRDQQEWSTIDESEKPKEHILIVDLGRHFIYARPLSAGSEKKDGFLTRQFLDGSVNAGQNDDFPSTKSLSNLSHEIALTKRTNEKNFSRILELFRKAFEMKCTNKASLVSDLEKIAQFGEEENLPQILDLLGKALRDTDSYVRQSAESIIKKMAEDLLEKDSGK